MGTTSSSCARDTDTAGSKASAVPPPVDSVILQDDREGWLAYTRPLAVLRAAAAADVPALLDEVCARVERDRVHAAGFLSYEAAPAMDAALLTRADADFPAAWFGLYAAPEPHALPDAPDAGGGDPDWQSPLDEASYAAAIARVKRYLHDGDTYQVNYSFRLTAPFAGSAWPFFLRLAGGGAGRYGAYLDTGRWAVCSASPELFLRLEGDRVESRPMKGTAPRGLWAADDLARASSLRASEKNRAENVMIVDMVRNDLGRVAQAGSVCVTRLYDVERYPTLWQMTSTVAARTRAPLPAILRALFPAASITGAPKARTMQIIAELETSPRRIYTGSIGRIAPGRRAVFNVAIRTALIDRERGQAEYGVGGGIVWDSESRLELEECRVKARVLTWRPPPFALLETLRWEPGAGCALLDRHLRRLLESADYFGFRANETDARARLEAAVAALPPHPHRVRLLLERDGALRTEVFPLPEEPPGADVKVALCPWPVDPSDPFLYHKTTRRDLYGRARAACPGCDDVLLWNSAGELTESCVANIVIERDGRPVTPPLRCGLLPGTLRGELLDRGEVAEAVVRRDELRPGDRLWLINSVRGRRPARLLPEPG